MSALENRIPPPLVLIVCLVLMKLISSKVAGHWQVDNMHWLAIPIALLGFAIAIAGVVGFRKARTTVNPLNPSKATSLVTAGIYRYTRNPMYLGMLLVTIAFAVSLSSYWSFIGVVVFALYITRFQIVPEERAMRELFGAEFTQYCSQTSRWL